MFIACSLWVSSSLIVDCYRLGHVISEVDKMLGVVDFQNAARQLVPSVSAKDINSYRELERKINQSSLK